MNIILFGPPGAGKGTQAKFLVKKLNGFQISTGDILRDEIQKNSKIGKKIVDNMNEGKFVDDEIVNDLIKNVIFDPKKKNKLIFDGYFTFGGSGNSNKALFTFKFELSARETYQSHHA